MSLRWSALLPLATTVLVGGCFPYHNHDGDYYAGPIDPGKFPAAYEGTKTDEGFGRIVPASALVKGGAKVAYYSFPVAAGVDNPTYLRLEAEGMVADSAPVYVFDGDPSKDSKSCKAPRDYVYDERRDFVHFDVQGNIFQQRQTP